MGSEKLNLQPIYGGAFKPRIIDCKKPWTTVAINWDGYVVPCGSVYDCRTYNYGNIFEKPFSEIWNGELYQQARRALANRASEANTICKTCKSNGFPLFS